MPNPYLPNWEYIPDGEPRVFGDRVYVYGSHDNARSALFCDSKLKVWSAHVDDLNNWVCHGDVFHTRPDRDHPSDVDWTEEHLYAPDVVYRDGKYYLYAYIVGSHGCVAVSDRPEGPFTLLSKYTYAPADESPDHGVFVDPGVLVDDDGRVYVYCGYLRSFMCELKSNMHEVVPGSVIEDIVPVSEAENGFFEACSMRKIGDTYYLIYSPTVGCRLDYMTGPSPTGPFTYRGTIIDNRIDNPGGNDHGSVCRIKDQWYIFYHRMTNNSITSRRGCVEKISILPDGSIPQVEMTSLGFEDSLNPYKITPADIACVLKGGCYITERTVFDRGISSIRKGCVIGYKYFDFGQDFSSKTMELSFKIRGAGTDGKLHIFIDGEEGTQIGTCQMGACDGVYSCIVRNVTGRHSLYFVADHDYSGWFAKDFDRKDLFEIESFVFLK